MKKYFFGIISLCFVIFFTNPASAVDFQTLFSGSEYYEVLCKMFSEATTSIDIVIDTITIAPFDAENPVIKLIDTLIDARKRGLTVRMVLEDSKSPKNFIAYRNLLENGIDVYFDTSNLLINSKAIVVDSHICVVGNPKWSPDSWIKNNTIAVILDSQDMAKTIEDSIANLALKESAPFMEEKPEGILIPHDFLLLKNFGIKFIRERADNPLSLYILLIKEAQESSNSEILLDYVKCGRLLGLEKKFFRDFKDTEEEKNYYYSEINKILKVLENRYHFVKYDKANNKVILLNQFDIDLSKPLEKHPCFILPRKFWEAGLSHRLSLNAKYLYFISLLEVQKSIKIPYWFSNEYILSNLYGLERYTVLNGLEELGEENLIEVAYVPRVEGEPKKDAKNVYCVNRIITDQEFKEKIKEYEETYGQEITTKAQEQATKLNEPKDFFVIETFIHLIQKYGYPAVRSANIDTLRYKRSSNLRHISTTIRLLEKEL